MKIGRREIVWFICFLLWFIIFPGPVAQLVAGPQSDALILGIPSLWFWSFLMWGTATVLIIAAGYLLPDIRVDVPEEERDKISSGSRTGRAREV